MATSRAAASIPPTQSLLPSSALSSFERQAALASPAGLAWMATRGEWQLAAHLTVLDDYLMRLASGDIKRLMVFMPPRSGKSELCSRFFPAWYVMRYRRRVILASYEYSFATYWGQQARELVREYGHVFGVGLSAILNQQKWWGIAGQETRASMMSTGAGGPLTGKGGDILMMDDPIKNAQEADSPVMRESLWRWYSSTFRTRLQPDGAILIVLTRWHHDDLAGRLLQAQERGEGEEWTVLKFPAIAEHDECYPRPGLPPFARKRGDALWPSRYPLSILEKLRQLDERTWQALYQQNPSPDEGTFFLRGWMQFRYREKASVPRLTRIVQAIDSAFKTGVASDYSVVATWGTDDIDYYLLGVWRARVDFPDLIRGIKDEYAAWRDFQTVTTTNAETGEPETKKGPGIHAILIEDAASGQSAIQQLHRDTSLPVVAVPPIGSKESRADAITPIFASGKVKLPAHERWVAEWVDEHIRFPRAPHDDQVDTTSMALAWLKGGPEPRLRFFEPDAPAAEKESADPIDRMLDRIRHGQRW